MNSKIIYIKGFVLLSVINLIFLAGRESYAVQPRAINVDVSRMGIRNIEEHYNLIRFLFPNFSQNYYEEVPVEESNFIRVTEEMIFIYGDSMKIAYDKFQAACTQENTLFTSSESIIFNKHLVRELWEVLGAVMKLLKKDGYLTPRKKACNYANKLLSLMGVAPIASSSSSMGLSPMAPKNVQFCMFFAIWGEVLSSPFLRLMGWSRLPLEIRQLPFFQESSFFRWELENGRRPFRLRDEQLILMGEATGEEQNCHKRQYWIEVEECREHLLLPYQPDDLTSARIAFSSLAKEGSDRGLVSKEHNSDVLSLLVGAVGCSDVNNEYIVQELAGATTVDLSGIDLSDPALDFSKLFSILACMPSLEYLNLSSTNLGSLNGGRMTILVSRLSYMKKLKSIGLSNNCLNKLSTDWLCLLSEALSQIDVAEGLAN